MIPRSFLVLWLRLNGPGHPSFQEMVQPFRTRFIRDISTGGSPHPLIYMLDKPGILEILHSVYQHVGTGGIVVRSEGSFRPAMVCQSYSLRYICGLMAIAKSPNSYA